MSASEHSFAKGIGVVLYGLVAGTAVVTIITINAFFAGVLVSWLSPMVRLTGEWGVWLPIAFAYYAFFPGVLVGAFVGWKVIRKALR
ncbi:MAG TPA: hypothetical protein VJN90_08820 [Candidatus Acidoferrales bacterium]|nr:hypothetical protein [Candidatus Acidoferrales bacterium]